MTDPDTCRMVWRGDIAKFMLDETRLCNAEGAFRSGKTTAALWKVYNSCVAHPGICWLICRYGDGDTQTKLKPKWRDVLRAAGVTARWDSAELCDVLPNGSKVHIFGIKAQDQVARYGKLRGLTLAGVYNDQTEELPKDIFQELIGRLSQAGFPHQMLLTPNPPDENHWLVEEFPVDNHRAGRQYYSIPIYANAANLHPDAIKGLEDAYPPVHPKHRSAVLGLRGLNVIGEPVYKGLFVRALHERPCLYNPAVALDEGIDFGKHHPCIVWRQTTPLGTVQYLGGLIGQNLYLEDFLPIVQRYRREWFPDPVEIRSCCDPAGSHDNSQGVRDNGVSLLQKAGFSVRWLMNSNAPDVRLAMVERHGGYMRRRVASGGEAFQVNPGHWLRVSAEATVPWAFLADGFEAGYVWDEHMVSVGSKQVRKPRKDGWFEHGMNCAEYLELNFGSRPYVAPKVRPAVDVPQGEHAWLV
jgi:hypothetical protein